MVGPGNTRLAIVISLDFGGQLSAWDPIAKLDVDLSRWHEQVFAVDRQNFQIIPALRGSRPPVQML